MFTITKGFPAILLAGLCALSISGCNINSEITNSYVDPEFRKLDLHGVLVVAVAQQQSNRIEFEESFTRALKRRGVDAVASHTLVPQEKATAEAVLAAAKNANLDTILVTRYVGERADEVYHPGAVYYAVTPVYSPGYYGNFGGFYGHATEVAYQQPVWTSNVTHAMISDLYATKTEDRLWQAVSETIESSSTSQVMSDAIDALIGNLKEKGLLN
jgi:ABC-type branched-subunit amino acid transport system substrate-binding protein